MAYRATAGGNAVSSPVGAGAAETARRHLGISNSSTTSRSTTKTSSSPYRSDGQLRNTSTSTSNYEPTARERRGAHTSDSESEGSERSLELASSHSSDEEASSRRASTLNGTTTVPNGTSNGLPPTARWPHTGSGGITYPPQLNIDSELFKAVYATARHNDAEIPHRWTSSTISDNELGGGGIYGVRGATDPSKISNVYSDQEDKASLGDKYLFPYTAEEDHTLVGSGTVRPYGHPPPMVYGPGTPGMMTPTNGVANSPSPLAMHHEYMMYPDISENEKATSETHV
uniref:Protocadherin-like wing polarity protein stan n=6 Tax=Lygus hesperus TaxID=30085 RepID=A0A0A9X6K0_LYGHE